MSQRQRDRRVQRAKRRRRRRAIVRFIKIALIALNCLLLVYAGGWFGLRQLSTNRQIALGRRFPVAQRLFHLPTELPIIVEMTDLIEATAGQFGLEPAWVAAVVMQESSYRTDAVSGDNAQGLMQILPQTAIDDIAPALGETYVEGCLFDPQTNLRYGCCYLSRLKDLYDGDMPTALAAYFQGMGTVRRWLSDPAYSSDGVRLTAMGTPATQHYVDNIRRYYERYRAIYET